MTNIQGKVSISTGNLDLRRVVAGTTGAPLAGTTTIGTGDYIDSIIVMMQVSGVGSCAVYLADGPAGAGTVQVHGTLLAGTVGAAGDVGTKQIFLGLTSRFGPWRITTQAGVAVTAIGRFS